MAGGRHKPEGADSSREPEPLRAPRALRRRRWWHPQSSLSLPDPNLSHRCGRDFFPCIFHPFPARHGFGRDRPQCGAASARRARCHGCVRRRKCAPTSPAAFPALILACPRARSSVCVLTMGSQLDTIARRAPHVHLRRLRRCDSPQYRQHFGEGTPLSASAQKAVFRSNERGVCARDPQVAHACAARPPSRPVSKCLLPIPLPLRCLARASGSSSTPTTTPTPRCSRTNTCTWRARAHANPAAPLKPFCPEHCAVGILCP